MGAKRPHTELYCHLVWATWDRLLFITTNVETRLFAAIRAKLAELTCSEITIGGMPDHIHLVCRFPPALAVSQLVQQVKGASSHLATHEIPGLENFKWQGGHGAFTLGNSDLPRVRAYVLNQKQHHHQEAVWLEYERTFIED